MGKPNSLPLTAVDGEGGDSLVTIRYHGIRKLQRKEGLGYGIWAEKRNAG
jgi:hypothetical protein